MKLTSPDQRPKIPPPFHYCLVSLCSCSNRLQLLSPFDKWDGKDLQDMTVLLKVIIAIVTIGLTRIINRRDISEQDLNQQVVPFNFSQTCHQKKIEKL